MRNVGCLWIAFQATATAVFVLNNMYPLRCRIEAEHTLGFVLPAGLTWSGRL
jgi:hypothetical protein